MENKKNNKKTAVATSEERKPRSVSKDSASGRAVGAKASKSKDGKKAITASGAKAAKGGKVSKSQERAKSQASGKASASGKGARNSSAKKGGKGAKASKSKSAGKEESKFGNIFKIESTHFFSLSRNS